MLFARAVNADCVQAQPGEGAVCQWHTTKAPTEAAAKTQGEEPWSPSAEGETLFSVGRIFGGELQNIPGGCFARGPLLKEKRGRRVPVAHNQGADRSGSGESLAWLLMMLPFVSPEGGTETTEDRRPLRGNQTHTGRYRNQK